MAQAPLPPKNLSPEKPGNGRSANKKGVYKHPETGRELTALSVPAADAFVRQGFEYVGPAPVQTAARPSTTSAVSDSKAVKKAQEAQAAAEAAKAEADAKLAEAEKRAEEAEARAQAAEEAAAGNSNPEEGNQ